MNLPTSNPMQGRIWADPVFSKKPAISAHKSTT